MTVLHAVLSLDVGGLERLVVDMVREAARNGHESTVLCIEKAGALAVEARAAGAQVVSLEKPPGRLPAFVGRAEETLARLRPDVVHTHQIGAAWYVGPGAARLGIPILHTEHGNHFGRSAGWLARLKRAMLYRQAARGIGRFCCVSAEISRTIEAWRIAPRAKLAVVPNGVRCERSDDAPTRAAARAQFGVPHDALVLGSVGRLAEVKRYDLLLRAARDLRTRFPNLWVLLAGDGPERARLESLAGELELTSQCVFAGYVANPEIALRAMDVFALSSRSEGFPVSLLEAWAAGVPTACSAVGGIPDVVADRTLGLLFDFGDLAGFQDAVATLLTDRKTAEGIAGAAFAEVLAKYSLTRMWQSYEREYRTLMKAGRGAAVCAS